LQSLCVRLKVASGLDLASACRRFYSPVTAIWLWLLAEVAIVACDMAEVLGSAVALHLLFRIPLVLGALLTIADVLLIFALERAAPGLIERVVALLLVTIAVCLGVELFLAKPAAGELLRGLAPSIDGESLYLAIGILGATVMPHNLYLHSALTPDAGPAATASDRIRAVRAGALSTGAALNAAFFLNAAILVLAAAVFSSRGIVVTDLRDAHALLTPLLGTGLGSVLFALGLLCSGQTSTITGTLAGQIVMEGFVRVRWSAALRRVVTRAAALIPAVTVLWLMGPRGTLPLLIGSQVVLSLQLPFAVVPLLRFTGSPQVTGALASGAWTRRTAVAFALLITFTNAALLVRTTRQLYSEYPIWAFGLGAVSLLGLMGLAWIAWVPLRARGEVLTASASSILRREPAERRARCFP
jgi:manganese transport protein